MEDRDEGQSRRRHFSVTLLPPLRRTRLNLRMRLLQTTITTLRRCCAAARKGGMIIIMMMRQAANAAAGGPPRKEPCARLHVRV